MRKKRCKSGLIGWQCRLQKSYDGSFEQWQAYAETYGLVERLGFTSAQAAWDANPLLEGSVNPSDFRISR